MEGDTSVDAHDQDPTHPNVVWSVKEARTRLVRGCKHCRRRKIRCDLAEPKCGNCARLGRECTRNLDDESQELSEEVRKPEQAGYLESEQSSNDKETRPSIPSIPNLSASPTSSKYTSQPVHPVPDLACNLSLSPQHRKRLSEWGPHHAGQSQ